MESNLKVTASRLHLKLKILIYTQLDVMQGLVIISTVPGRDIDNGAFLSIGEMLSTFGCLLSSSAACCHGNSIYNTIE